MSGKGRPHSTETKLGLLLQRREIRVYAFAAQVGVSPRMLTEYLAGRRQIRDKHLSEMCRVLGVEPEDISGDSQDDVTDAAGRPLNGERSVKALQARNQAMRSGHPSVQSTHRPVRTN